MLLNSVEAQAIRDWVEVAVGKLQASRRDERGASELVLIVIITGLLAAGAIAIIAIIILKSRNEAESIPFG